MEVSERLRESRVDAGMTQEAVAEAIGVSRQTVSNWERGRTYPDIVSVVALSDLYGLSLDAMFKEDKAMLNHLAESTDVVRSRARLTGVILLAVYLVVWGLMVAAFWLGGSEDAMGFAFMAFYIVLPALTLALSALIGRSAELGPRRWLAPLFFGAWGVLGPLATFEAANYQAFGDLMLGERIMSASFLFVPYAVVSLLGMGIGVLVRKAEQGREQR